MPDTRKPPDVRYLPTEKQQAWLIDALAELLGRQGTRQFLSMPLVEPTRRFFPDPWSFSEAGLDRVTRRLMQYAGLADLDVTILPFDRIATVERKRLCVQENVAGFFLGIEDGRCTFGFNVNAPADEEHMAGIMAHEVAHAYRAYHGLRDDSNAVHEEWRTDVTASYLGFGILVANNSYRYRVSVGGIVQLGQTFSEFHEGHAGYLTPQAFCFLLAIQMQARSLGALARLRLLDQLETTQRAFAKAARERILEWPEETFDRLLFPHEGDLLEDVPPEALLLPLPEYEPEAREEAPGGDQTAGAPLFNLGHPVFRLGQSRTLQYGGMGVFAGLLLTAGGAAALPPLRTWWLLIVPLLGLGGGLALGSRTRFDVCADPDCGAVLPSAAATCPNCGGLIAGTIRRPSERLEAQEEYERAHPAPGRRRKSSPWRKRPGGGRRGKGTRPGRT